MCSILYLLVACRHRRQATSRYNIECSECEKKFKSNSELMHHLRIHSSEKPYECDICAGLEITGVRTPGTEQIDIRTDRIKISLPEGQIHFLIITINGGKGHLRS